MVVFGRNVPDWFRDLAGAMPELQLRDGEELPVSGWSVKPFVLSKLLDEGAEAVVSCCGVCAVLTSPGFPSPSGWECSDCCVCGPDCEQSLAWGKTGAQRCVKDACRPPRRRNSHDAN